MTEATVRYNFREAERKWQQVWQERELFAAKSDYSLPKFYALEMFPYPSGRIHMGHVRNYTLGDVTARYKRAKGYNVLYAMGWDAFGLPAENAAIQNNSHPGRWTYENIGFMRTQLKTIGLSYDWNREIATCSPDYYAHEQRFFTQMLKADLAYRKESWVNWDPVDQTVLANEQVIDGCGWRSGAPVERKRLSQWFLPISDFAQELLEGLDTLDGWPEKVRVMQENWIGRSEGATVQFPINGRDETMSVYTTRPDTIFGMSFLAIAPNHPLALELAENDAELAAFIKECEGLGTSEEAIEKAEKRGFKTLLSVSHPFIKDQMLPIYVANFVLMDYGTGAVFGCPAHDERDHAFASKYGLPILPVVSSPDDVDVQKQPYTDGGDIINSDFLNGLSVEDAKSQVIDKLESMGWGERKINYRLRDWGISRQRYWGCPIPVIYCESCGAVPVPDEDLPVTLPEDVSFDAPGNPLAHHPTWRHTECPTCKKEAVRETDTFDTFFESSWYFMRFCSPHSEQGLDPEAVNYWMPVDRYIGGIEHAVLHLLYARYFTRVLSRLNYTTAQEPFKGLLTQGMICHETYQSEKGDWLFPDDVKKNEDGTREHVTTGEPVTVGRSIKMSKSKKNTVDPDYIISTYGADAARLFMMSDSPPERDLEWSDAAIDGAWRYINRLYRLVEQHQDTVAYDVSITPVPQQDEGLKSLRGQIHKTIKNVSEDIENFRFNKAVARLRELTNALADCRSDTPEFALVMREGLTALIHLLAPFMPHLAEELWVEMGGKDVIAARAWPEFDASLVVDDTVTIAVQVNGKLRATIQMAKDTDKDTAQKLAMEQDAVQKAVDGKEIVKTIVVPGKIVNVVAK